MRIFDIIARLESAKKLARNHFRANLTLEKVLLIRKLRFNNLVDIFNSDTFSENSVTLYLGFWPNLLEPLKLKQFIFHHTAKINKPLFVEYEHEP